jgi:hypothetical protein
MFKETKIVINTVRVNSDQIDLMTRVIPIKQKNTGGRGQAQACLTNFSYTMYIWMR